MGLPCVQRWSKTENTVSSKVEKTETVNEYAINEYHNLSAFCCSITAFSNRLTLELRNNKFRPQIRILREISSLEPVPKVWKPKSRSKHMNFMFLVNTYVRFLISSWG